MWVVHVVKLSDKQSWMNFVHKIGPIIGKTTKYSGKPFNVIAAKGLIPLQSKTKIVFHQAVVGTYFAEGKSILNVFQTQLFS